MLTTTFYLTVAPSWRIPKFKVYRHERKKTYWVIDPPGFDTRGAAGWNKSGAMHRKPNASVPRRENDWKEAGGRIVKGFPAALAYAHAKAYRLPSQADFLLI